MAHIHVIYMCVSHGLAETRQPPSRAQCELRYHHPEDYPTPCEVVRSEVDVLTEEPFTRE